MVDAPHILFVDDEPAVHDALARNLHRRKLAWRAVFQQDPRAALEAAVRDPPAAAVLDLLMPEMDGLELAEKMRAAGLDCPIVILSGCNDFSAAQAAINRAKAFRYYVKPCPTDDLVAGVEEALALARRTPAPDADGGAVGGEVGAQALNRLALGVVVVDAAGAVVFTNQRGGALLAARDGLSLDSGGVCRAERRADSEALAAARREAVAQQESVALSIERSEASTPLRLVVMPFDESGRVLLFITDPDEPAPLSPELIGQMFGLTPSEARLTAALAGGLDLAEAAETCNVTKTTARSYLKQIFLKVGVSRQAELVQAVLSAAGAR
jgi:DNA-binding NarL/FixJ family response regulator